MTTTTTPTTDRRRTDIAIGVAQTLTFGASFAILLMCVIATTKFASTPFEIYAGLVIGGILSIALVVLGVVFPLVMTNHANRISV